MGVIKFLFGKWSRNTKDDIIELEHNLKKFDYDIKHIEVTLKGEMIEATDVKTILDKPIKPIKTHRLLVEEINGLLGDLSTRKPLIIKLEQHLKKVLEYEYKKLQLDEKTEENLKLKEELNALIKEIFTQNNDVTMFILDAKFIDTSFKNLVHSFLPYKNVIASITGKEITPTNQKMITTYIYAFSKQLEHIMGIFTKALRVIKIITTKEDRVKKLTESTLENIAA